MQLKYLENKITFVIDTFCTIGFEHKGSSFVIHKLAYELANLGNIVYIFNTPLYPHQNINVINTERFVGEDGWQLNFSWTPFEYNIHKTVSIYTQITVGNPFNTLHNTRWILHHYEKEKWVNYEKTDYICNFGDFDVPDGTDQSKLTIFDYKLNEFHNKNNPNRKGFGHILHKNTPSWGVDFLNIFNSTEIPHYNGTVNIEYLVDEFNKYEYLLTFDDKSYYPVLAALCGTKSIILNPNKNVEPLEYRIKNPTHMCGVAYGLNDIKWADLTINLVRDNLVQLDHINNQTVYNFIEYWEKKLL